MVVPGRRAERQRGYRSRSRPRPRPRSRARSRPRTSNLEPRTWNLEPRTQRCFTGGCLDAITRGCPFEDSALSGLPEGPTPSCPYRLVRPRTLAFHASNAGSNPAGDASARAAAAALRGASALRFTGLRPLRGLRPVELDRSWTAYTQCTESRDGDGRHRRQREPLVNPAGDASARAAAAALCGASALRFTGLRPLRGLRPVELASRWGRLCSWTRSTSPGQRSSVHGLHPLRGLRRALRFVCTCDRQEEAGDR